jgi:hypothetical protein
MAQISEADVKGLTDAELQDAYSRNLYVGHATRFAGLALGAGHAEAAYNSKAALDAGDTVSTEESLETQKFFADKIRDTRDKLLEYKQSADLMKAEAKTRGLTLKREPHVNEEARAALTDIRDSLIRAGVDLKTDRHPDLGVQIDAFLENATIPAPKTGLQATEPSEPVAQTPSTPPPSGATAGPLTRNFNKRGGYTPLEATSHMDAVHALYLAAEENPESVKLIWCTGTGADGQAHKIDGPNSDHVPLGIQVSPDAPSELVESLAGQGLTEGRGGIWFNEGLAEQARYLDKVQLPDAPDAKVAQAPEADAPPAHETQQQLIPGPFGVSL